MPSNKHIIVIHGRATKPSEREKSRLIRESLLHGLKRQTPELAAKIESEEVKLSVAYYGDISNFEMVKAGEKDEEDLQGSDPEHPGIPCELPGSYDDDLETLLARVDFTKKAYKELLKENKDSRYLDNVASFASGALNFFGLSERVIRKATPDMGAYLTKRSVGSAVRERLQKHLKPSLLADDDICLIGHSMGSIVAYDVLWKYSRMSEYKELREKRLSKFITIGCPLGEPGVQDNLYDANEGLDGKYPTIIKSWANMTAKDDFVAHDATLEDDFQTMRALGLVDEIVDHRLYNFWVGSGGSNPHKLYGYLDNPKVAAEIAGWMSA